MKRRTRTPQQKLAAAAYMRQWRLDHPPSEEQRLKGIVRATANVYQRRGLIERRPCEVCGARAEKHHDDYTKPLQVRWFCTRHHKALHCAPLTLNDVLARAIARGPAKEAT